MHVYNVVYSDIVSLLVSAVPSAWHFVASDLWRRLLSLCVCFYSPNAVAARVSVTVVLKVAQMKWNVEIFRSRLWKSAKQRQRSASMLSVSKMAEAVLFSSPVAFNKFKKTNKFCSAMQLIWLKYLPCFTFNWRWNSFVKFAFISLTSGKLNWQTPTIYLFYSLTVSANKLKVNQEKEPQTCLKLVFFPLVFIPLLIQLEAISF